MSSSFDGSLSGSLDLAGPGGSAGLSYEEVEQLATWVLDRAEVLRRKVGRWYAIRTFGAGRGGGAAAKDRCAGVVQ